MTTTVASASLALASVTPMLTTTFAPTATCTENRLTMLANRGYEIWMNMPVPVPNSTFSDCYPSQYMTSYLLSAGGVTQPAFNPLVCPQGYSTIGPYTSNYIACCPSGYLFASPTISAPSDRPAFGGTCYTPILEATPVMVTAYGSSGVTATTTFSATVTNAQAYAYPIDGFAYGVAEVISLDSMVSVTTTSASTSSTTAASGTLSSANTSSTSNSSMTYVSANNGNALKIGLGVGLGVFAVLLLSLGIYCLRRKRRTLPADVNPKTSPLSEGANYVYAPPPDTKTHELHENPSVISPSELDASRAYELQGGSRF
jgi:hypothetical protein